MNRNLSSLLVCLAVAGCAVGPDYRPPAVALPPQWARLANTLAVPEPADTARWWQRLRDPVLAGLVESALAAHPDLAAAQARLRQARAQRRVSGAGVWPELSATAAASRSESSSQTGGGATRKLYRAELDASWEVDLFGSVRRAVEAAQAEVEGAEANLAATRVSLAAETALAYVDARNARNRLTIARDNLARQSETLQITQWRAQAGLVSSQDVEQARANVEQTRAQIPALEQSLANAEDRLALLAGEPLATVQARLAAGALPDPPPRLAVGIPADILRQRPDVAAAERQLAAATARVGQAEAARYPRLTLSGTIGLEALTPGALGEGGSGFSTLLAQLAAPLFDAGRRQAQVEVQDAQREQAEAQYRKTLAVALQEVEDALAAITAAQGREASLATAAEAARNAALLARHRYQAGLTDFQSVLDTERNRLAVEDALASTRAERVASIIRLYKALGGGWPGPEEGTRP